MYNPRSPRIVPLILALLFACGCSARHSTNPDNTDQSVALESIARLAGVWETAPGADGTREVVKYKVTSGGSAVEEMLFPGTDHEMISVYFMDHGNLHMTHYCMLKNQPTLAAEGVSPNQINFELIGGTNFDPARDPHMHQLKLSLLAPDHIRQEWVGYGEGKPNEAKVLDLRRVPKA